MSDEFFYRKIITLLLKWILVNIILSSRVVHYACRIASLFEVGPIEGEIGDEVIAERIGDRVTGPFAFVTEKEGPTKAEAALIYLHRRRKIQAKCTKVPTRGLANL
jgi:hypothetical protein